MKLLSVVPRRFITKGFLSGHCTLNVLVFLFCCLLTVFVSDRLFLETFIFTCFAMHEDCPISDVDHVPIMAGTWGEIHKTTWLVAQNTDWTRTILPGPDLK